MGSAIADSTRAGSERNSGSISTTASAADPIVTTLPFAPPAGEGRGCDIIAASLADSALGVPLRRESAANGETEFDRAAGSGRRTSNVVPLLAADLKGELEAGEARAGLAFTRTGPEAE